MFLWVWGLLRGEGLSLCLEKSLFLINFALVFKIAHNYGFWEPSLVKVAVFL